MIWEWIAIVPPMLGMGIVYLWVQFRNRRRGLAPTTEKLLRSPGESLAAKIRELDDALLFPLLLLSGIGLVTSIVAKAAFVAEEPVRTYLLRGIGSACLALTVAVTWRLVYLLGRRSSYNLGLLGERAVGEELNQLMLEGCHVFHDFPGERWNIDHIIITRSAVFAVETKARRKKLQGEAQGYRVVFDGQKLLFPDHWETAPLQQAQRNAQWLAGLLAKATQELVTVEPIVTLPGWFVERTGRGAVHVLNPREIGKCVVRSGPPRFSDAQLKRIIHQIENKCRDVEI